MNPSGSTSADRFKQISEAYSVLSDPISRKKYDETLLHSSISQPRNSNATYADMSADYTTRNAKRRATANYAWSTRSSRSSFETEPSTRQDPLSSQTTDDFLANLNRFERLAARRRKMPQSASPPDHDPLLQLNPSGCPPNSSERKASAARQATQLALMLSFILWVGSKLQP